MATQQKTILIYLWDMGIGGVQKRVYDIIRELNKTNPQYQVRLILQKNLSNYLYCKTSKLKNTKIYAYKFRNNKKSIIDIITFYFWLTIKIWQIKSDVILTFHDRLSIQIAIIRKIFFWRKTRLILNESILTSDYLKLNGKLNFIIKPLIKLLYPTADSIIVPTKAINIDLNKNFQVPNNKIKVIPHWIIDKYDPGLISSDSGLKRYDFIFTGRLEKEKNIFWLIDLIKLIKKIGQKKILLVIGEGSLAKQFTNLLKDHNMQTTINFLGFKNNVYPYFRRSKILLLPSVNEGMPNSVLEAGICGLPAVVLNFKGASEIIKHGHTGLIANNKHQFIDYSCKLSQDHNLIDKYGKQAQLYCKLNFNIENLKTFITYLI